MSVKDEGEASWVVKAFSLQHRSCKIWVSAMDGSVAKTAVRVVCAGLKWLHMNKPVMLNYCLGELLRKSLPSAEKLGWVLKVLLRKLVANCTCPS